jgi:O-antigen/teichoic acid export membrane protein
VSDTTSHTSGGSVLRGGLWYMASRIVPQFYTFVTSIVAARVLGPHDMGRQSFIAFTALTLTTLLTSSLYLALVRFIGETLGRGRPELVRGLLVWALRVELVAAVVGGVVVTAIGLGGGEPKNAWFLAAVVCALSVLHTLPSAALAGMQRFREASLIGLATGLLGTGATIAVLTAGGGITGMFAVEAAMACVTLTWTGTLARRLVTALAPHPQPARELSRDVARYAALLTLGVVLTLVVARRSELFFVERFSSDDQIAAYSIVFAVMAAALYLPQSLADTLMPAFASLYGEGASERIRSGFGRALRLLLLLAFPLTAVGASLGPSVLELVYGQDYRATGAVLLVMIAAFPFVPLASLGSALLTGLGRLRLPLVATGIAAAVDVALAVLLVPALDAVGAAIANVGGQVALAVPLLAAAIRATGRPRLEAGLLLRGAVAATVAGLAAIGATALGGALGVVVGLLLFGLVFAALARALRILPADDAAWLDEGIGARLGGGLGRAFRACSATR